MTGIPPDHIDLYWRPGCGFCSMLRRRLDKMGIERIEHDIWSDPDAAAIVRHHAAGSETVPTVVIDGVGLVNPGADEVVAVLAERAPHLLPEGFEPPASGPVGRLLDRVRGVSGV